MTGTIFQVADTSSAAPDLGAGTSFLRIAGQAQGFEWPILAILLFGVFLLATWVIRQLLDRRSSRALVEESWGIADDDTAGLIRLLEQNANPDNLSGRVGVSLLSVWRTEGGAVALNYELAAVLSGVEASYKRVQRMVTFLSAAAGGIGLLGTLVGIYVLFSSGSRSPQIIFAGIALAVVSTLLGIVVSIILELLESITYAWVSRYLERVKEWGAMIRFRLMNVSPPTNLELHERDTSASLG